MMTRVEVFVKGRRFRFVAVHRGPVVTFAHGSVTEGTAERFAARFGLRESALVFQSAPEIHERLTHDAAHRLVDRRVRRWVREGFKSLGVTEVSE